MSAVRTASVPSTSGRDATLEHSRPHAAPHFAAKRRRGNDTQLVPLYPSKRNPSKAIAAGSSSDDGTPDSAEAEDDYGIASMSLEEEDSEDGVVGVGAKSGRGRASGNAEQADEDDADEDEELEDVDDLRDEFSDLEEDEMGEAGLEDGEDEDGEGDSSSGSDGMGSDEDVGMLGEEEEQLLQVGNKKAAGRSSAAGKAKERNSSRAMGEVGTSDDDDIGVGILGEDEGEEGDEESGSSGDEGRAAAVQKPGVGGFAEGSKGVAFAKAFQKILEQKAKKRAGAAGGADVILTDSAGVQKRKAEVEAESKAGQAAKKLKLEMRRRGHVKVSKRGENPAQDQKDKQLQRLATRGVVLLFNAVAKAQKSGEEASGPGGVKKVEKLNRASFLAQLKGSSVVAGQAAWGGAQAAGSVLGVGGGGRGTEHKEASWKVLQEGFTGLGGGRKMKDWDKQEEDSADEERDPTVGEEGEESGDTGGSDDGAW